LVKVHQDVIFGRLADEIYVGSYYLSHFIAQVEMRLKAERKGVEAYLEAVCLSYSRQSLLEIGVVEKIVASSFKEAYKVNYKRGNTTLISFLIFQPIL